MGAFGLAVPLSSVDAKSASRLDARNMPRPYERTLMVPPELAPMKTTIDDDGHLRHHYHIEQKLSTANIVPGLSTPILGYNGMFPGPTIKVHQGERITLEVDNILPLLHPQWGYRLDTSTHLHGSASLPQYDGYANDLTGLGYCKDYKYPNFQPARTLWYHDHAVHRTSQSVYSGLAGQYHLHDDVERSLLPQGQFDVPLTVTDAMFAANGALAYDDNSRSGLYGDVVMVNGAPWPVMKVQRRIYRFRVLNASISRSYNFSLSTGEPVTMVATDGGLMPVAQQVTSWRHAGGERYEVLIDFSKYSAGKRVELLNSSNDNNVDYDHTGKVMAFDVTDEWIDTSGPAATVMPALLAPSTAMELTPSQSVKGRHMRVKRDNDIWTIGGMTWDEVIQSGFKKVLADPNLDDVEIWEIENSSGGWFHPVHVHLVDFQILSRNGRSPFPYERGPKDTVYVGEGETVRLLMKFEHHRGRYMIHCHNLPHEDHDMMAQYSVGLDLNDPDPNHPIEAAWPHRIGEDPDAGPFADVPASHPFAQAITFAKNENITTGYPDGSFRPFGSTDRAAMAAFLYRFTEQSATTFTPPATPSFADVPVNHQFFKEIEWLKSTGITTGMTPTTFAPEMFVNRKDMAAFLYRLEGEPSFNPPAESPFADLTPASQFYKEITWLHSEKITTGYPDGYHPMESVHRQATAAFLYRMAGSPSVE